MRVETKTNGLSQPFERLAESVGSLIPILSLSPTQICLKKHGQNKGEGTWSIRSGLGIVTSDDEIYLSSDEGRGRERGDP